MHVLLKTWLATYSVYVGKITFFRLEESPRTSLWSITVWILAEWTEAVSASGRGRTHSHLVDKWKERRWGDAEAIHVRVWKVWEGSSREGDMVLIQGMWPEKGIEELHSWNFMSSATVLSLTVCCWWLIKLGLECHRVEGEEMAKWSLNSTRGRVSSKILR